MTSVKVDRFDLSWYIGNIYDHLRSRGTAVRPELVPTRPRQA